MIRRSEPMMSPHASTHPLTSDLLDFVEGTLSEAESRSIDKHLAGCVLCRIKRQRLTNVPPVELSDIHDVVLPTFSPVRSERLDGSEAVRGELWTTAGEDGAIVLIRSVRDSDWGVVVVPVIFDVEVADSGAVVLDESASPLRTPIAIYERMTISLPLSALAARLVLDRAGIDLWSLAPGDPGVTRGSGLQGATDPRIELRQYLSDRLVALNPHEPEGPSDDEIFEELVRGLYGQPTVADQITLEQAEPVPASWRGIARVHKFGRAVLFIDTTNGLEDEDRRFAVSLCDKLHGAAVAIMAGSDPSRTDLFPRSFLVGETSIDSGDLMTGPLITGQMVEVITRYLDHLTEIPDSDEHTTETKHLVDPKEILASKVAEALSQQVAAGKLAEIPSKKEGYQSVADDAEALTEIVQRAFSGHLDLDAIKNLSERGEQE